MAKRFICALAVCCFIGTMAFADADLHTSLTSDVDIRNLF